MSTTTNIVLNDGTANQTFIPVKRDGGRLSLVNRVGAVAAAYKFLTLGFDLWSARRATTKVTIDLDMPLERTDSNGVVTATNVARSRTVHTLPSVMTAAELTVFANLWKNAAASAIVQAYVTSGDPML